VHKSQKANKDQTLKKLTKIIKSAFKEVQVRKKTKAPKWAVDKRIAEKKRRGKTRASRTKIVG
jgi:ribosome-associated protein